VGELCVESFRGFAPVRGLVVSENEADIDPVQCGRLVPDGRISDLAQAAPPVLVQVVFLEVSAKSLMSKASTTRRRYLSLSRFGSQMTTPKSW
jgi:hypothetical protein